MSVVIRTDAPPIREDATGALRVGDSRILLEMIIEEFQDGATPETIVQQYSTLALSDVYAVIGYYLRHRQEVDAYMNQREDLARQVRHRMESALGDLSDIRRRLLAQMRS